MFAVNARSTSPAPAVAVTSDVDNFGAALAGAGLAVLAALVFTSCMCRPRPAKQAQIQPSSPRSAKVKRPRRTSRRGATKGSDAYEGGALLHAANDPELTAF